MATLNCFTLPVSASQDTARIVSMLAGTWNEVTRTEPTCENKKYHHVFTLSADELVLTKRYLVPYEGNYGPVAEERFRVLYSDDKSLMLFREGETFEHRDTGDKVVRQLIVESGNSYAWRVYGMPRDHRAAAGGLRCSK
jgi:hypothetical protein